MMTAAEIYALARNAGFPGIQAVTMTAIALRESAGDPNAFNGNAATGDRSYGLWQINLRDPNVASLMFSKVIPGLDEKALLDPATNARAAYALWGGKNANLDLAWYITRPGPNRVKYESHLPAAQAAALAAG
jgi:hypothetical protein